MSEPFVFIGAGGHARVLLEALHESGHCPPVGVIDERAASQGPVWFGIPVLGGDEIFAELPARGMTHFVIAIGSARATSLRERLYDRAISLGLRPIIVRHPSASISASARIGPGAQLLAGSVVNAGAVLADNVIVNSRAVVEHDCEIGAHVHVATGAVVCGGVKIGARSHIGAGAIVRQGISLAADSTVGIGGVVVENVSAGTTVAGNPARLLTPNP